VLKIKAILPIESNNPVDFNNQCTSKTHISRGKIERASTTESAGREIGA
jgi:hypothetical protein